MEGQQLPTGDFDVRISDSSNRTSIRYYLYAVHGEQEMNAKVCKTTGCPKKRIFRIIILQADTSERSACRVMILKMRCFWTPCTKTLFEIITSEYTLYSRLYFILWGEGSSIL